MLSLNKRRELVKKRSTLTQKKENCFGVFWCRPTFGIVKGDKFVGLDVVNQGWHGLVGCHFLSSCSLQGIDRKSCGVQALDDSEPPSAAVRRTSSDDFIFSSSCSSVSSCSSFSSAGASPSAATTEQKVGVMPAGAYSSNLIHRCAYASQPWLVGVLGEELALSWGLAATGAVAFCSAAAAVFLAWVDFSWLPFLFLMRILPMSSDGLGICWPGFS